MAPGRPSSRRVTAPQANGVPSAPAPTPKRTILKPENMSTRVAAPRLKLIVRRLPPGLTESEFEAALGEDWKVNGGKVDWLVYKAGKISKDLAKPSRPSRAYVHLTKADYITPLERKIRSTDFDDAASSSKDSTLLGPPTLEFAPYVRMPNNKARKDARQGTIDQDPEFIEFLESLTNPIVKVNTTDQENEGLTKSKEAVTTTPLIQYLRDKKANKGKEPTTPAKTSKHARQDSKDNKAGSGSEKKAASKPGPTPAPEKRSAQAIKVENAARDAVKVLSKQAANNKKSDIPPAVVPPAAVKPASPTPLAEKKRERGDASVAARILQRDLGLTGRGGRGGRRGGLATPVKADVAPSNPQISAPAQSATVESGPSNTTESPQILSPKSTNAPAASSASHSNDNTAKSQSSNSPSAPVPPTGPAASRNAAKPNPQARGGKPHTVPRGPNVSPTATQAFLKHANPSQGITEPLLEEAFATFGKVNKVEIDKKKGFAYVDFAEPDGLQKAVTASPIKVAQGQVVVLERKTGPTLQARNSRGGPAMAGPRGGMVPSGPRGGRGVPMRRGGGPARAPVKANNVNPSTTPTQPGNSATDAPVQEAKAEPPAEPKATSEAVEG